MSKVVTVRTLQVKCRCQFVVRLKANKCYQELLCFLSSYINLLDLLNLQGLRHWFLTSGRFHTSSPWSRPLTNSKSPAVFLLVFVSGQSFLGKVWPLSDKSLALSQSERSRLSCSSSVARLIGIDRSIIGLIGWCFWYCYRNHSPERFKTQSCSKETNDYAFISDPHQDYLHTLRDHLDKPLDLLSLRSLSASTMLQDSSAGVTAVNSLHGDPLYYRDHSTSGGLRRSNGGSMDKLILMTWDSGRLHPANLISRHCSTWWLQPRFLLIELRVPPIALPPRLVVAFIYRASRFLSTPPLLAKKALICR